MSRKSFINSTTTTDTKSNSGTSGLSLSLPSANNLNNVGKALSHTSSFASTPSSGSKLGNHVKESTTANYNKEALPKPPALNKILQKIQQTESHLLTSTKRIDAK